MTTARSERPRYFEGQYIGSADLMAAVDYSRELAREGALAGQTWGICVGLDLVETANASGGFDYFVLPGFAFDGYGRAIVVLAPAPVPAALFAGMATGNQRVWIRYDERETRGLRPGWESCGSSDAYSRVRESYAIEAGPMSTLVERQTGIDLAGQAVADARLAQIEINPDAALLCDGSVPHQTFPPDTARWLVPLGAAAWTAGAPGQLGERTADAKKISRSMRRYVGQVAETLYAADGVLRLRDRQTDRDDTKAVDDQCAQSSVTSDDLVNVPDPKDSSKTLDRLAGRELVWIEGHMRVTGDARLWGTRLEFRAAKGSDEGIPLHLNRRATLNADGGQDLELALGSAADGKTRLVAGIVQPGQPIQATLQFRNDGRLAVGNTFPADVKTPTILAYTPADTTIAIAAAAKKLGKLMFAVGPGLTDAAHVAYDDATQKLRVSVGADLANATTFAATGHVGIRMDDPIGAHADGNDLVINNLTANPGLTLLGGPNRTGNIHFADGLNGSAESRAGFVRYDHAADRLQFGTTDAVRATIDSTGRMGLATVTPAARFEIHDPATSLSLRMNGKDIQCSSGGAANLLELQPAGGGVRWHGDGTAANRAILTADARLALGTDNPFASLHIRRNQPELMFDVTPGGQRAVIDFARNGAVEATIAYDLASRQTWLTNGGDIAVTLRNEKVGINLGGANPQTTLHVKGNLELDAGTPANHLVLFENTGGPSADVLALRVGGTNANASNNYITFFDNTGPIGRIEHGSLGDFGAGDIVKHTERAGTFLRLVSGGADFAECLPRESGIARIGPGRIVGVREGRISLETEGAEALLVTTDRAVVLGNAPGKSDESEWEQVAMVGQVPVFVEGPVSAGDFILPSHRGDGCGHACAPAALDPGSIGHVVGRAWESCGESGRRRVLVAVGVAGATPADAGARVIAAQADRIAALEQRLDALLTETTG
jgi:hypothetical protein